MRSETMYYTHQFALKLHWISLIVLVYFLKTRCNSVFQSIVRYFNFSHTHTHEEKTANSCGIQCKFTSSTTTIHIVIFTLYWYVGNSLIIRIHFTHDSKNASEQKKIYGLASGMWIFIPACKWNHCRCCFSHIHNVNFSKRMCTRVIWVRWNDFMREQTNAAMS